MPAKELDLLFTVCTEGLYLSGTTCASCPLNTYKVALGNDLALCVSCPTNAITTETGRTARGDCGACLTTRNPCPSSWFLNGKIDFPRVRALQWFSQWIFYRDLLETTTIRGGNRPGTCFSASCCALQNQITLVFRKAPLCVKRDLKFGEWTSNTVMQNTQQQPTENNILRPFHGCVICGNLHAAVCRSGYLDTDATANGVVCVGCAAGQYLSGATCVSCPDLTTSDIGSDELADCGESVWWRHNPNNTEEWARQMYGLPAAKWRHFALDLEMG